MQNIPVGAAAPLPAVSKVTLSPASTPASVPFGQRLRTLVGVSALCLLVACASTAVGPGQYRVQQGDTLTAIARKHGRSVSELMRWNSLANANRIEKGQVLRVAPAGATGTAASSAPAAAPATAAASAPARPVQPPPSGSIPLAWPVEGKIVRQFGGNNKGLDIANSAGTPIKAAANGTVAYAGDALRGYGNLVILRHDKGVLTIYGHNRKLLVKEGQRIKVGQTIAEMGSQGNSPAALYFEVRANGTPADPRRFLPAR